MEPILQLEQLNHVYSPGTPFEHRALIDIDLSIEKGSFVGLIGHTGSGKTTLIQHLNGLLKPTSGRILYNGEDIWSSKQRIRQLRFQVGLVFQYPEYQLFEETVYRDIAFGPKNMGLDKDEVDRRVRDALRFVDLPERIMNHSPFELSGGQKRRVAIAGVIAMEPEVLILDEPIAGLDPESREAILRNIQDYHALRNNTVILVTHNMDVAARMSDRLLVMNHGSLYLSGTPEEVFSQTEALEETGLAVPEVTQICDQLRRRGIPMPRGIYTIEAARDALLSMRGGIPRA